MIAIGIIIIVLLLLIVLNIDRIATNIHSTNKYLNDISNKLDDIKNNNKN